LYNISIDFQYLNEKNEEASDSLTKKFISSNVKLPDIFSKFDIKTLDIAFDIIKSGTEKLTVQLQPRIGYPNHFFLKVIETKGLLTNDSFYKNVKEEFNEINKISDSLFTSLI
jgi:hypothetical protein